MKGAPLQPGERVLWYGRLAVGAPWRLGAVALLALQLWAALVVSVFLVFAALRALSPQGPSAWSVLIGLAGYMGVIVALPTLIVAISSVMGPSYGRIAWLLTVTPSLVPYWALQLEQHGWPGAFQHMDQGVLLFAAVFVALPAAGLLRTFVARLEWTCAVTDRRLLEVDDKGRVVRERSYVAMGGDEGLRVARPWRCPEGLLTAGPSWAPLELALRDDDPAQVLELVRAARAESSRT